jgi:hypothetical protein
MQYFLSVESFWVYEQVNALDLLDCPMTMATSHALSTSSSLLCTPCIINVSICNHLLIFQNPFSGRAYQALTMIWG